MTTFTRVGGVAMVPTTKEGQRADSHKMIWPISDDFSILPSELSQSIRQRAPTNETLERLFQNIEGSAIGGASGDTAAVVAADGASVLTRSDLPITDTVTTRRVTVAKRGSGVGTATFVAGKRTVTVPLVLDGALNGPDAWWRLTHPAELLTK